MSDTALAGLSVRPPAAGTARTRRMGVRALVDGLPAEWFSGELVLQDLESIGPDQVVAARAILLRFLAAQYFTNELRGDWPGHLLRQQRSAALNALGRGLSLDREQRALHLALERCGGGWGPSIVRLLGRGAAAAQARGHSAGALALYYICFEAAWAHGWWADAAAAALAIAGSVSLAGDERTRGRWRRRAAALARRAAPAAPVAP